MKIEEFISLSHDKIDHLKEEIEKIENKFNTPLLSLKEDTKKVVSNPQSIVDLDLNLLGELLANKLDSNALNKLKLYSKFYKNKLKVNDKQEEYIRNTLNDILIKIEEKQKEINKSKPELEIKRNEIKKINNVIEDLNNLLKGKYFKCEKLDEISSYLKKIDYIDEMQKVSLLIEVVLKSNANINKVIENQNNSEKESKKEAPKKEVITDTKRTNLNESEVILLFNKYELKFKNLKKEDQEIILSYANFDEMDKMLGLIQKNRISLNISERGSSISRLLTFSDSEILNNIINNIKEDIKSTPKRARTINEAEVYDVNKIFQNYLKENSIFIKNQKYYKLASNKIGIVLSSYNNYLSNRELFKNIGLDLKRASVKSPEAFTYSSNKVKENIQNLAYYSIPLEIYEEKLTVLKSSDIQGTIDQFIEVEYFEDYALHNPTRLILNPNDIMFYRIIKSKQEGRSHSSLFYGGTHKFKGEITSLTSKLFDMTDSNKSSLVGEYHPNILSDFGKINPSLTNELIKQSNYINALEQFKIDDYRYNIDGIIVSRKKVLRYYESILREYNEDNFEGLRYSIFKNSIFTKEMCDKIDNVLNTIIIQNKGVELK